MQISSAIEAFILQARLARLATVDERGRPHVVPICFAYRDGVVYSALDAKPKRVAVERLRRVRNLLVHPDVQVLIDRYDEDWSRLAYVQLRGRASLLQPGDEHTDAVALLRGRYQQYESIPLESLPLIKVTIDDVVAWGAPFAVEP